MTTERLRTLSAERRERFFAPAARRARAFVRRRARSCAQLITFKQLNLMHPFPMKGPLDAIFCRNVVIYFDKDTQRDLFAAWPDCSGRATAVPRPLREAVQGIQRLHAHRPHDLPAGECAMSPADCARPRADHASATVAGIRADPALLGAGHERWTVKILPGEYYVTRSDEAITTVLGSCISACIRDPVLRVGGMNHFMLPEDNSAARHVSTPVGLSTRYGSHAMESLINDLLKLGGAAAAPGDQGVRRRPRARRR